MRTIRNIIFFIFCFISASTYTQSFMGGYIHAKRILPLSSIIYSVTVEISIRWPQTINKPYININWGDSGPVDSIAYAGSTCNYGGASNLIYTGIHSYQAGNLYSISVVDSFYPLNVWNIPNSNSQKVHLQYALNTNTVWGINNSPVANVCLTDSEQCCIVMYSPALYDSDGDSLSYSLIVPPNIPGYIMPTATLSSGGVITVNSNNSYLTALSLKVDELRKPNLSSPQVIIGSSYLELMFITPPNPTGVESNENNREINIYPNPTKDFLSIAVNTLASNSEPAFIITDILGNIVTSFVPISPQEVYELNISRLTPGLYILNTISAGKKTCTKIFKE